ncbi:hypothetical protein J437_LFUL018766 [Ladona fulva]|uniref:Fatty acyl-CoA reductase n=1 Tax=Ladona fulva TaxID=123851 RepID=A0A8K0KQ22_LADFU|nr:hypothetical protein J437_LFUL018766 [Ladona fulva]
MILILFERIRKERPGAENKVKVIPGDLCPENDDSLGISEDDAKTLQNTVSIVFHCAATLRLEAKLKDAILTNTMGTWKVLQFSRGMNNLEVSVSENNP